MWELTKDGVLLWKATNRPIVPAAKLHCLLELLLVHGLLHLLSLGHKGSREKSQGNLRATNWTPEHQGADPLLQYVDLLSGL